MYRFTVWRVVEGNVLIADSTHKSTTVILKEGDVGISAIFVPRLQSFDGMALIPAKDSSFLMGDGGVTTPVHAVSFTCDFWMDTTEVTQQQFTELMEATYDHYRQPPWHDYYGSIGPDYPANYINWYDALLYCNARTKAAGSTDTVYHYDSLEGNPGDSLVLHGLNVDLSKNGFHLPTEAQWEYACRAGTTTMYYFGDDSSSVGDYAWYAANSDFQGQPVAQKLPNGFNLYDMCGNCEEWCNDCYADYKSVPQTDPTGPVVSNFIDCQVLRGGRWDHSADRLYSSHRAYMPPDFRIPLSGFRTCFTIR